MTEKKSILNGDVKKIIAILSIICFGVLSSTKAEAIQFSNLNDYSEYELIEDLILENLYYFLLEEFEYQFLQNQDIALQKVTELHHSFPLTRNGQIMFPEFYGGSYINNCGNLVTLIVYNQIVPRIDLFGEIKFVNYSYATLNRLIDEIALKIINPYVNTDNFSLARLDTSNNNVTIELHCFSDDAINFFRNNILDHSALYFNKAYYHIVRFNDEKNEDYFDYMSSDDNPSTRINWAMPSGAYLSLTLNGTPNRSAAYRALNQQGQRGFLTAAHRGNSFLTLGQRFYSGSPRRFVGEVTQVNRALDAAFVRFPMNGSMGINAINGRFIDQVATVPVQWATVSRISAGNATTPLMATGGIRSTNVLLNINGYSVNSVEVMQLKSDSGDSGGIIVHGTINFSIGGVVVARSSNFLDTFYVSAVRINNSMGLRTH